MAKEKKKGWKALTKGGVIEGGGTAKEFKTGDWRSSRPILLSEKCINCLACWMYCPDSAVIMKDGKVAGFDYDYCKGCGICAHECPVKGKAIKMIPDNHG
ncbi:MAG: hypothetical protein A3G36_05875 [Omnitrophica bacterium RIFCSPLOWO2_12_FULL_45_13]|nr:MAG: hypothetical protein A3G36_05875 [Omnitrophica bacterium RIFCSPLOWO2_12_FULL_45_13]